MITKQVTATWPENSVFQRLYGIESLPSPLHASGNHCLLRFPCKLSLNNCSLIKYLPFRIALFLTFLESADTHSAHRRAPNSHTLRTTFLAFRCFCHFFFRRESQPIENPRKDQRTTEFQRKCNTRTPRPYNTSRLVTPVARHTTIFAFCLFGFGQLK